MFSIGAAFPLALLVAIASLGGILLASPYAQETANWTAQAVGQDWVDLLIAVPWLVVAGGWALRGSRRALLLLAGAYAYCIYEFVIYGFAVHFNSLFLIYCAALGLSVYALGGLAARFGHEDLGSWSADRVPVRTAGGFLIAVGILFAGLWLAEIVPALARGVAPRSLTEVGLLTNPVHVMDLSVVLPAHVICGVQLLRRKPRGYLLAPIILAFGVLMALSIAGMMVVMGARGAEASLVVAAAMAGVAAASAALLIAFMRALKR